MARQSRTDESWDGEEPETKLLQQVNASLHELSQPLTVLLCALELGAGIDTMDELKQVMSGALDQCRRLQETVHTLQIQVLQSAPGNSSTPAVWT